MAFLVLLLQLGLVPLASGAGGPRSATCGCACGDACACGPACCGQPLPAARPDQPGLSATPAVGPAREPCPCTAPQPSPDRGGAAAVGPVADDRPLSPGVRLALLDGPAGPVLRRLSPARPRAPPVAPVPAG